MTHPAGSVLRITRLVNDFGTQVSDDAWGIVLDGEDMMVFEKRERDLRVLTSVTGWISRVCPLGWGDEDFALAKVEDVPADIPPDFWPLAARLTLAE